MEKINQLADVFAEVFHELVPQEMYLNGKKRLPIYYRIWRDQKKFDQSEIDPTVNAEKCPLGYQEIAKIASYLDVKTLLRLRCSRKFKIAAPFGALEVYQASMTTDDSVYAQFEQLQELVGKLDPARLKETTLKCYD